MDTNDKSLRDAATAITLLNKTGPRNVVVQVTTSCVFHLGFDEGEEITPERLLLALTENAARTMENLPAEDWIDTIKVLDITNE